MHKKENFVEILNVLQNGKRLICLLISITTNSLLQIDVHALV